jgi:hypothetical protein
MSKSLEAWGLCVDCSFWQIEPSAVATHQTAGSCLAAVMQAHALRVTGNSGCRLFVPGTPQRAAGASTKPTVRRM